MQLQPYDEQVQAQLAAGAALGDERTREIAAALGTAAAAAVRLALLDAAAALADEVTAALLDTPGTPTVSVRLDGDEVVVGVSTAAAPPPVETSAAHDGDTSARISLRLSESLKAGIDAAADRDGVSVNTWLVRAASAALRGPTTSPSSARRITGWVHG